MASSLNGTGVAFSDSTAQATAFLGGRGQVFNANGTFTIPTGITAVKVTVIGGGGGGAPYFNCGSNGSCGGAGGSAIKYLTGLTPGATLTVVRGAGGTVGGTDTNNSTNGGASSVSSGTQSISTISATGGAKAGYGYAGAGGTGSGGDLNVAGARGGLGSNFDILTGAVTVLGMAGGGGYWTAAGTAGVVIFEW